MQCRYFYYGHKGKISLCTNRHSNKFPDKINHNGHNHVCRFFRPIKHNHPDSILKKYKDKLRFIENLRGRYINREIWILATGPSLDDIPRDFLKIDEMIDSDPSVPKISIAVKEAAMPFPDCTYNIWPFRDYELRHIYLPRHQIPSNFDKFIFTIREKDRENYYGEEIFKSIYLGYMQGGTIENVKSMCENIVTNTSSVYYGVGTITHLAIAAALVMGATRVSLIGCDHGAIDGKIRAQSIKGGYGWQSSHIKPYEDMRVGTNFLADFFRNHGIEIVRYYHGKGYEEIGEIVRDAETVERAESAWKDIIKKGTDWEKTKEDLDAT